MRDLAKIPIEARWRCAACNAYLTWGEKMRNLACPRCGNHDRSTVVPCHKEVGRWVPAGTWWQRLFGKKTWVPVD